MDNIAPQSQQAVINHEMAVMFALSETKPPMLANENNESKVTDEL